MHDNKDKTVKDFAEEAVNEVLDVGGGGLLENLQLDPPVKLLIETAMKLAAAKAVRECLKDLKVRMDSREEVAR